MHYISDALYWISTGLLVPVVAFLIFFFFKALVSLGTFYGQYLSVRKERNIISPLLENADSAKAADLHTQLPEKSHSQLIKSARNISLHADSNAQIERELALYEQHATEDMQGAKTLAKMPPMLGLMGTLIPMGPALVGLSAGDLATMAYNMQVAFATTVVGLFAAAIGLITLQAKKKWHTRNLNDLQYIADLLEERTK